MGGKKAGENTKKVAGNAKKAEQAARKQAVADEAEERKQEEIWAQGAKDNKKKASATEKAAEQKAKKEERDRLLAEEEASQPLKAKGENKKTAQKKSRGTLDLDQLEGDESSARASDLNATGIDNALDALSLTANSGEQKIDRHPERRREAAYKAYAEWRDVELKAENPGLRQNQRTAQMRKEFEKRPENPMNQNTSGAYNATKDDIAKQREVIRNEKEIKLSQPNRDFK